MQKRFLETRKSAREFASSVNGKVIDCGVDAPNRWMVEYEAEEPGTHSISMEEVQSLKQTLSRIWKEEANEKASKAANASPVVNRDNSRVLVSRNKREGKYAGTRSYHFTGEERKHVRGGKYNWRYVL